MHPRLQKIREAVAWKGLRSLEFRVLHLFLRGVAVLLFLFYLAYAGQGAWLWADVNLVRSAPQGRLAAILARAEETGDYDRAVKWLRYRPAAERAATMKALEPHYARLPSTVFFDFALYADMNGDTAAADLWYMIARYRLRFDLMRCGRPEGVEDGEKFVGLLSLLAPHLLRGGTEAERRALVPKVLDFDAAHPAANDPSWLCTALTRLHGDGYIPAPKEDWEDIRRRLRDATQAVLAQ